MLFDSVPSTARGDPVANPPSNREPLGDIIL